MIHVYRWLTNAKCPRSNCCNTYVKDSPYCSNWNEAMYGCGKMKNNTNGGNKMIDVKIDGSDISIIVFFICWTVYQLFANGYIKM